MEYYEHREPNRKKKEFIDIIDNKSYGGCLLKITKTY